MRTATARGTRTCCALLIVLCLPARSAADTGRVVSATVNRAYVDRGAANGLARGQALEILRASDRVGPCVIEELADHAARCSGKGIRVGDRFLLPDLPPVAATAQRPPPPTPARTIQLREALLAAPLEKVAYTGPSGISTPVVPLHASFSYAHASWLASGSSGFHGETVQVALRGLEIYGGWRAYADASVVQWISRPEATRYRPGASTQLFVRELSAVHRERGTRYAFALGRVRPWHVPGVVLFDGAQAAWRTKSGSAELGVFGGELPDIETIDLRRAWLAGGYWSLAHFGTPGDLLRVVRQEGRVGILDGPRLDQRLEAQALLQVGLARTLDLGADVRVGRTDADGTSLDGFRFDLSTRPIEPLHVSGGFRHDGIYVPELAPLDPHYRGRADRADVVALWELSPAIIVGAGGGYARELDRDLTRGFAGPQIDLPRLFGTSGGASLGYSEELGWIAGRTAWIQTALAPARRWQLIARLSYLHDAPRGGPSEDAVGLYGYASVPLASFISARVSIGSRVSLESQTAAGLVGNLALRGDL